MPRAILVKDRRVMVAPGTRRVIVFDTDTGKGAECCCGNPTTGSKCCTQTSSVFCTTTGTVDPVVCVDGKRMEFTVTGEWTNTQDTTGYDDQFLNLDFHSVESVTRSMGAFWQANKPESDDLQDCGDTNGPVGEYSTRYELHQHGTGIGVHPVDYVYTDPNAANNPFVGTVRPGWGWNAMGFAGGPGCVPDILLGAVLIINRSGTQAVVPCYGSMQARHLEVANLAGTAARYPFKVCSGTDTSSASDTNQGSTIDDSFSWNGRADCTGGACNMSWRRFRTQRPANFSGPANYDILETMTLSASWSMKLTQCDGRTDPWTAAQCAAFIAAFIAGDAAGDYNHDGFVDGDDYDQFSSDHPECLSSINPGRRDQAAALRPVRRRAVVGALTASGLLGI